MIRFLVLATLLTPPIAFADGGYLRFGGGFERSAGTVVHDRDCASVEPPALFGCVAGPDGRSLGARGNFGSTAAWELAVGRTLTPRTGVELAVTARPRLDLDAQANFLAPGDSEPVHARGRSLAALAVFTIELGREAWRFRPFVLAGAGVARNHVSDVLYTFPTIGPEAVTIIRGGSATNFAWTAGAGITMQMRPHLALDLTFGHADLGEMRTEAGPATIIRPTRQLTLDIAGTRASVATRGVMLSMRISR